MSATIERTASLPYLVLDGRRMIPDYDVLSAKGYDYLAVGGALVKGQLSEDRSTNGSPSQVVTKELMSHEA